jgi:L-arabinokinase
MTQTSGRNSTATVDPLSIAYYCTGHGLGHATRSIEVCKHLVERGHTVTVITGAPPRVFLQEVSACSAAAAPHGAAALQA